MNTQVIQQIADGFGDSSRLTTDKVYELTTRAYGVLNTSNGTLKSKGRWLSLFLKKWNIKPKTIRFDNGKVAKGYYRSQFAWVVKTGEPIAPDFIF